MLEMDKVFAGSVPENYDRHMVPLIFEVYAADMAQRAASLSPGRTSRRTGSKPDRRPHFQTATSRHPLGAMRCDCQQLGVKRRSRASAAYREAKRVLKPGGHFLFSVWDRIEENLFADDVTNALSRIFPNDPPRFLARTPHGYHDKALIRSDLDNAGFSHVVIETRAEQSRASSPRLPAVAYCQGTLLRNEIESREAGKLEFATDYAASALADRHGAGEVVAKIQAHVIMAAA